MSTRNQPYRHKMPVSIATIIGVSSRVTLYLLGQNGPTSFVFKDRLDNKYKVSIGSRIQCSCQPNKNDHCLHSIYVMTRLFNIPTDNPLIWQASYLDSELSDIIAGKYSQTRRRMPLLESFHFQPSQDISAEDFQDTYLQRPEAQRMKLVQGESPCPICQENMDETMLLTHCRAKCGNNFHHNCVKIWVQHKISTQAPVTCPMCRCDWGRRVLETLSCEQAEFKRSRYKAEMECKAMEFACKSCGLQKIPNNIYKCLLCEDYSLCGACFVSNKHMKHPFIVCEKGEWHGAPQRREHQKKIIEYINKKRQQSYTEQLISKFSNVNDEDPAKLIDYLASAYPYVSKYISENLDPYKKLDIDQNNMKCMCCDNPRMIYLRRLNCGHYIDHNCLKQCILKGKFYCNIDGSQFLKGYESLMKRRSELQEQLVRKTKYSSDTNTRNKAKLLQNENEMYNMNTMEEQQNLQDIISNVMETVRQNEHQPGTDRLSRRLNSNIVQHHSYNSHSLTRQDNRSIRIRNVLPRNNKRTPNVLNHPSNIPRRPPHTLKQIPSRAASLSRKPMPTEEPAARFSIQSVIARRGGQQQ